MAKNNISISNVHFRLIGGVTKDGLQEVICSFKYKGHNVNYFIFIERYAKESAANCIKKAKAQLTQSQKSGELLEYSERYIKGQGFSSVHSLSRKGMIGVICGSVVVMAGLLTGGIFIGKWLFNGTALRPVVTFDAAREGAHFGSDESITKVQLSVDKGTKFGEIVHMINTPTLEYNDFRRWTLDNEEVGNDYVINDNLTVNADYISQTTTIYLDAAADGYGTLTALPDGSNLNDMVYVVGFTVNRGSTLREVLVDEEGASRFTPTIYKLKSGETAEFCGWSMDGGATYINPTAEEDDPMLDMVLEDEKYDFVAGYVDDGENLIDNFAEISEMNKSNFTQVVFSADNTQGSNDRVLQTGGWEFKSTPDAESTNVKTLGMRVNFNVIPTLLYLENLYRGYPDYTWYADPDGNYAGFEGWCDSHSDLHSPVDPATISFSGGDAYSFTAHYTPNFATDSWKAVVNNAELGLKNLHYVYENDLQESGSFAGTLIGKTRNCKYTMYGSSPLDTEVRVIGEGQDYLDASLKTGGGGGSGSGSGGGYNLDAAYNYTYGRPVALTFETVTSISGETSCDMLGNHLNSFYDGISDSYLRDGLKSVKKFEPTDYSTGYVYGVFGTKVFTLSVSEVCGDIDSNNEFQFERRFDKDEPDNYAFYNVTGHRVPDEVLKNRWLRSRLPNRYAYIQGDGYLDYQSYYMSHAYVSAAFCIGRK